MADAAVRSGDIYDRDINLIDPDPENTRDMEAQIAKDDIEVIARSILARGYDADQEILVRSKPYGRWMVTDGHKRRLAFLRAIELGASLRGIPCRSERQGTGPEDRAIIRLRPAGRELSPLEAVSDIKRLLGWGWSKEDIAEKLARKVSWVDSCLELAETSFEVRQPVRNAQIAPTEALKIVRRHGEEAGPVIERAIQHARARGKSRATGQDVEAVTKPRTQAVSLCTLAMNAVTEYRKNGPEALSFEMAMEALEKHFGPLMEKAA